MPRDAVTGLMSPPIYPCYKAEDRLCAIRQNPSGPDSSFECVMPAPPDFCPFRKVKPKPVVPKSEVEQEWDKLRRPKGV